MENFTDIGLRPEILKAITELGYEKPTPIQEKVIPVILNSDKDLIALAQTGTGKTAAFGLPLIEKVDPTQKKVQGLILCPTRELGIQIFNDLENYSKYIKGLGITAVYGGASMRDQIRSLRNNCQIVVGTPGRVLDLIERGALDISAISYLVLDEADEMLNMGFQKDLDAILSTSPAERQTLLFSATMPQAIARMARNYMNKPEEISVGTKNTGAANVKHEYFMVHAKDRYEALKRIADIHPDIYGIIFCRTRTDTTEVSRKLINDGYNAAVLNGDLSQSMRDQVMDQFRSGQLQLLVATDVAARGLDVNDLTHVINYQLPDEMEVYIHRSGRTGRAGKSGTSISIVHTRETRHIRLLENLVGKRFERKQVPTGEEICEKRLYQLVKKVEDVEVNEKQIASFLPAINQQLEAMSKEELIKRFFSVEFNQFLDYYKNAPDLNIHETERGERGERGERSGKEKITYTRLFMNLGIKQEMHAGRLMGIVNDVMPNRRFRIGKIDIFRKFSFFEVESNLAPEIIRAFKNIEIDGVAVEVDVAKPDTYNQASQNETKSGKPFTPGKPSKPSKPGFFEGNDAKKRKRKHKKTN
ncbi:MAG: DEAD/DEAH box helicase [Bacteroidia bacterium]|nr:DEAD/DEAH box helicase [Bacteroidia bacterium]